MGSETQVTPSWNIDSWDAYWQGAAESDARASGGTRHPAAMAFWSGFFRFVKEQIETPAMIDIASGNGAVVELALAAMEDKCRIQCIDESPSAVANIEQRFDDVSALVADARSIPFETASFDIVTSQFGIEYAGMDAFEEAARLVAEGGWFAALVHKRGGQIYQQSESNRDAVRRALACNFVGLVSDMFEAGFVAARGGAREPYDEAASNLVPAAREFESIIAEYGKDVADGTLVQLYGDVARIHERIQKYDPEEVLSWLSRMERELEAYAERMVSMCDSAIDEPRFEQLCARLAAHDLILEEKGPFYAVDSAIPLAWAVIARKQGI